MGINLTHFNPNKQSKLRQDFSNHFVGHWSKIQKRHQYKMSSLNKSCQDYGVTLTYRHSCPHPLPSETFLQRIHSRPLLPSEHEAPRVR